MTKRVPRPGRELEALVAKLEHIVKAPEFTGQEFEIVSPTFWVDPDTGEPREIDVSIGPKGAPPSACIMVECRDRGKRQDSMWLEQVEGKRRSLGPKHVIVVSRRGFTKPAMKKAAAWGIELRLFEDLDPKALRGWLCPDADHMSIYQTCMVPDAFSLDLAPDDVSLLAKGPRGSDGRYTISLHGVVFVDSSNGRAFETKEAGSLLGDKALEAFKSQLRPNGGSKSWNIRLHIPQDQPLMLRTRQGVVPILQLRFKLTMWLKE